MTKQTRKRMMERKILEAILQQKSNREICQLFKTGARKVRRIRYLAEDYGYLSGANSIPPYPEALFPNQEEQDKRVASLVDELLLERKDWIVERLKAKWHPITVFEELGFKVGRSSFYRFLLRHNLSRLSLSNSKRVVPEIVHTPGEALLLDWGKLRDVIDPETGKKRILWAFVGVLGFSRYMMVRLVWSNDTRSTLGALESMFTEMGGVPLRLTSDNPKCFCIEASDYEPILNPALERFASHYNTQMECLPPADPQKKGKVERLMPYVRRLYEAHGSQWLGIEESQTYIDRKIVIANDRVHGTTRAKPIHLFLNTEVNHLKALPALAYEPEEVTDARVRRDGHVRFDHKYYSLPESWIGKTVTILATAKQVSIYGAGKLIEIHNRIELSNSLISKSTKSHHKKPWEASMGETSIYRQRAQANGPECDELVSILLNQGDGFIDTRKVWGILSLDKSYSKEQINEACRQAIEMQSYSYQTVKRLLRLRTSDTLDVAIKPAPSTSQKQDTPPQFTHKFARPFTVYEEQLSLLLH